MGNGFALQPLLSYLVKYSCRGNSNMDIFNYWLTTMLHTFGIVGLKLQCMFIFFQGLRVLGQTFYLIFLMLRSLVHAQNRLSGHRRLLHTV